jgi:hypothetical protein
LKIADSKMKKLTKERWIFTTGAGDVFCFEQSRFHENHLCFMFFQVFRKIFSDLVMVDEEKKSNGKKQLCFRVPSP